MIFNRNVFIEEQQYAQNTFLCKCFKKKKKKKYGYEYNSR